MPRTVFVTGATGFIAKHIVLKLLERGETVVGSARTADRDDEIRKAVAPHLTDPGALDRYRTVALDLTSDDGWNAALDGVDVLIHTASPFPMSQPKNPDDLIRPAVDGAKRALSAAKAAEVKRVVLTSSSVAVMEGHEKTLYDETDWSDLDKPEVSAYAKSKTLAERAAWDFVATEAPEMELAVINPTFVLGAPLDGHYGTSVEVIDRLMKGKDPMLPRLGFACCDVGDVAEAHVRAVDADRAAGHRHLIFDRFMWFSDMADSVRQAVPKARPARRVAPDMVMRILGLFDPAVRGIIPQLGRVLKADNTRMKDILGMSPRDTRESVADAARWLDSQKT